MYSNIQGAFFASDGLSDHSKPEKTARCTLQTFLFVLFLDLGSFGLVSQTPMMDFSAVVSVSDVSLLAFVDNIARFTHP